MLMATDCECRVHRPLMTSNDLLIMTSDDL